MGIESLVLGGQAFALKQMRDQCTMQRPQPKSAWTTNANTGAVTITYVSPAYYTGACKLQGAVSPSGIDLAEAHLAENAATLSVPMTVTGAREGDLVTITASLDPDLVGRTFRVQGPTHKTALSARRLQVVEVTG